MSARTAKQAKENDSSAQGKQKQSPQQELNASWADLRRFLVRDRVRMLLQRHSREPICVRRSDTVQDAFSRLCDNDILAAPVVDWEDRYEGFVSMLDLTSFAVELAENCGQEAAEKEGEAYWNSVKLFRQTPVMTVSYVEEDHCLIKICRRPRRRETHGNASIFHVLENLFTDGESQHQMALVNAENQVIGVITQSSLIGYLVDKCGLVGLGKRVPISKFRPFNNVISCMETDRACDAFKNMHLQKVQGIAVTDEHGNLTDALSVRDLRNIRPGSKTFSTLFETVKEFKESVRKDRAKTPENMVTVGKEGTLGDVLNLMNQHTVHRVFVVMEKDGKQKVRDIITMTDVLKYILQEIRRG